MWLVIIIIVCIISGFAVQPVDRIIRKKVSSKWLALTLRFVASFIIILGLYWIADLLGFSI